MKKTALLIGLVMLITCVEATKYTDSQYVWVRLGQYFYKIDKNYPYDYVTNYTLVGTSINPTLAKRGASSLYHVVFPASGNYYEISDINKTYGTFVDTIRTIHNNYRGIAVYNNVIYLNSITNVTALNQSDASTLWSYQLSSGTTETINWDLLTLDNIYIYVGRKPTSGDMDFAYFKHDGTLMGTFNFTYDGNLITTLKDFDIDSNFIYLSYTFDGAEYVGITYKTSPGVIIDYYNLTAHHYPACNRLVYFNDYIYCYNINNSQLQGLMLSDSMSLVSEELVGSGITTLGAVDYDNDFMYVTTDQGLYVLNSLIYVYKHIIGSVDGVSVSGYKAGVGTGQVFADVDIYNFYNQAPLGAGTVLCELYKIILFESQNIICSASYSYYRILSYPIL